MNDGAERKPPLTAFAFPVGLALIFLALHLPYLPSSLEDLDSINFALGVRHFDVAQHQPHPPGYPVFIAVAKAVRSLAHSELAALAVLSVVAGALGVVALAWLFLRIERLGGFNAWMPATIVSMTAPLYWFTAVRPLSDMTGLAATLAVQAMTLGAAGTSGFVAAAFAAGVATGIRSQVAWLTVPLLIARVLAAPDRSMALIARSLSPLVRSFFGFLAGVLVWFVPLVVVTGGPSAYWHALSTQGAEDLGNITMLWTTHSARAVAEAMYYALVAPWATLTVAIVVLVFALAGVFWLWRHNRAALAVLAAAFGPYFVFDLLFQETFTSRYALPLVPPVAYLATAGMRLLPRRLALVPLVALAMYDAHVSGTSIAAYSRQQAPAFRLLDDMARESRVAGAAPVLAMDRRNSFDFRRPIRWAGAAMPPLARTLPAPPQHEWLEAVKYWTSGGRAPVWFVVDPKRTSIDLVQHGAPTQYRWPLPYPVLVSGARPDEMDWYRVRNPEWYVGEGWSLTPEAAGVADADKRGLAYAPIHAGVATAVVAQRGVLVIGGRSFDPAARPHLTATLDGEIVLDRQLDPGAFVEIVNLGRRDERGDYAALTIAATPRAPVAIEQFDASSTRPMFAYGAGWNEAEFDPATGKRWRWLSERGVVQVVPRVESGGAGAEAATPITLHIEGESPRKYFPRASTLVVRAGDRQVLTRQLDADFSIDIPLPTSGPVTLDTDQIYVPAERSRRTQDRRHLGLRIYKVELR